MSYRQFSPHPLLSPYIDAYWSVTGNETNAASSRILPDGCIDIIINLGADFVTDSGVFVMQSEKVHLVGTMTRFKETFPTRETRLIGVRFKPGGFSFFYDYCSLDEVKDQTIEFDKKLSPDIHPSTDFVTCFNHFFLDRLTPRKHSLFQVVTNISKYKGQITVDALAREHNISVRQMERNFRQHIGATPKEFINFVRYQFAFEYIQHNYYSQSLLEIAFETGYYDHAHLANEIKKYTGLVPSQL